MMWYWGTGGAWWMWMVGVLTMLIFWGGIAALVVLLIRGLGAPRQSSDSAMDTLRRRLAAGEITQEEFERIRKVLQS